MTDKHPVTPPPHLIDQWTKDHSTCYALARRAAQWGADQELEACCEWVRSNGHHGSLPDKLRSIRRPEPPSLKEEALSHFESYAATFETAGGDSDLIFKALKSIPAHD